MQLPNRGVVGKGIGLFDGSDEMVQRDVALVGCSLPEEVLAGDFLDVLCWIDLFDC